jgi:hypothetical protein
LLVFPIQNEGIGWPGRLLWRSGSLGALSLGPYDFGGEASLPEVIDRDLLGDMWLEETTDDVRIVLRVGDKDRDVARGHKVGAARPLAEEVEGFCG